jgi:hypothetical protein
MANRMNRYRALYEQIVRPNNASTIPRHVFSVGRNSLANKSERKANKDDCLDTTFVHLTERFNNKEVYLVGTLNQSTMLAQRTQKLVREIQPEAVMVQTNEDWAQAAKLLRYVDSQEEFNGLNQGWELSKYEREAFNESNDYWFAVRKHFQNFRYGMIMS